MKKPNWEEPAKASADPGRVRQFLNRLVESGAGPVLDKLSPESRRVLATVLGGSQALGDLLVANPEWLAVLDSDKLRHPRRGDGIRREVEGFLRSKLAGDDFAGALAQLRRFKQREQLRIAARDLARLGDMVEITLELSSVADVCLDAALQICWRRFADKSGRPFHQDAAGHWQPTPFCVLGLGKLGGQELNYSSDVDLMFVYGDEGEVFREPPGQGILAAKRQSSQTSHQFFCKLAEAFVAEVSRVTEDGFLFRTDLRLRPEGDSGPLTRSLESYENYYAEWGQTWERMMLIKTRPVAGDPGLAAEFIEMIQPFRFPQSISANILHEVAAVKDRIEKEVVRAEELERNVKLGRGGIREIEFIAQSLQILHAGRQPFLQTAQTLPCLAKLAQYHLLAEEEAGQLEAACRFLRDTEHRLQMENNLQTHTIPADPGAQLRLARLMGFESAATFELVRQAHTGNVRRVYDRLFKNESAREPSNLPGSFDGAVVEWEELLASHSFRDPAAAVPLLREFAEGPGYVHVLQQTTDLARRLIARLLALCPQQVSTGAATRSAQAGTNCEGDRARPWLSDPDRVLTRLDSFIAAYGPRAALMEMWNNNPALFELMLLLFDRSEFLAEAAIRDPDLIDDVVAGGRLRQRKTEVEILRDLRHGLGDADQFAWLRRYHQAELMRLGLRDILGLADFEQNLIELSALADACLQYALEVVMRKNKIKTAPFAIIGFGKLGGSEIDYGSDLDIVFVADARTRELPKLQRLAVETMDLLSRRTEQGMVFRTDARLRPDGEKGLLVNTLAAYEDYYRRRAQVWEIQALTRTRPVAGDARVGAQFQQLAASLADLRKAPPGWKKKIHLMRLRIEKERTPGGQDELAIKTGKGGLMDAEFIAQALCLGHGWQEANTLRALERARDAGALPEAGKLIENYRQLRRVEGILRRWSYEGETVLPDDPAAFYRVSVRCGFLSPEEFRRALTRWRRAIREVYHRVFSPANR